MSEDLREILKRCGAVLFGDFVLSSGKRSGYYVDIKRASTQPEVLRFIAKEMKNMIEREEIKCDRLAGVVLGSIPLVVALSLETGIPYAMIRKERKEHGTGKEIEGTVLEGERVVVVEDVVTSALSVTGAVNTLRNAGAVVDTVLAVIDREEGGGDRLREMGVRFFPLLTASQLLEELDEC